MMSRESVWDRNNILFGSFLLVALVALYFPFLQTLVADWAVNDDYSHGYFIPFLTLYFIYHIRDELKELKVKPNIFGLLIIAAGLGQLLIAKIGSEFFLQRTSLVIVLYGLVLFFLGWDYFKKLFLPLSYLFFMVPLPAIVWNKIAFPMQLFASGLTENMVYALGIPIFRQGNVLQLAETTLEVVAACSGLRSLMTMFALSGALAFISELPRWKKWLLFFAAAPIAVIANITRLTGTAILASRYGSDVAQGFLHDFSGLVVFGLGLGLLVGVNTLLTKTWK